jgi:leucyl aminopeptidase
MPFESSIRPDLPAGFATPLLAVAVPQGALPPSLTALDEGTGGALTRLFAAKDFAGRKDETAVLYPGGSAARVLLVGVGKAGDVDRARIRRVAAIAARRAQALGVQSAAFFLTPEARGAVSPTDAGQAIAEGLGQGAWQYTEMKQPPEEPRQTLERVEILAPDARAEVEASVVFHYQSHRCDYYLWKLLYNRCIHKFIVSFHYTGEVLNLKQLYLLTFYSLGNFSLL